MALVQFHVLPALVVGYPDAVPVDVRQGLRALVQAIQAHEMGDRHGHGLSVRCGEGLGLLAPLLHFLAGVGLLGKVNDLVRKESLRRLPFPEFVLDALAALAEVLKGIAGPHVVKAHEFVRQAAALGFLEFAQMFHGLFSGVVGVGEHGVVVEHVHGGDVLLQGLQSLGKLLQLRGAHHVDDKGAGAVADVLLRLADKGIEVLDEVLRQIRVPGIQARRIHVRLDRVAHLLHVLQVPFVGLGGIKAARAERRLAHEIDAL